MYPEFPPMGRFTVNKTAASNNIRPPVPPEKGKEESQAVQNAVKSAKQQEKAMRVPPGKEKEKSQAVQNAVKSAKQQEKAVRVPPGKEKEKSQAVQNAEKSAKQQEKVMRVPPEKKTSQDGRYLSKSRFRPPHLRFSLPTSPEISVRIKIRN